MNLRIQLAAALLALTLGGWECGAISGGGAMSNGSVGGARVATSAPAVVGIDWPEGGAYGTLQILFEAEKETTFANNDPVETPTHFGALTLGLTQGTLASRLTYQSPCSVGPAMACYYADGGDNWVDTIIRSSLRFLHDGTGVTCYSVFEPAASAGFGYLYSNGTSSSANVGFGAWHTGSTTDRVVSAVTNGAVSLYGTIPTGGTGSEGVTWGAVVSHGTARSPQAAVEWRGSGTPTGETASYAGAASSLDATYALHISSRETGLNKAVARLFVPMACYDASHTSTEIAGVWAAVEARTGVLPQ